MKVIFGVVVCVLINFRSPANTQDSSVPNTISSLLPTDGSTPINVNSTTSIKDRQDSTTPNTISLLVAPEGSIPKDINSTRNVEDGTASSTISPSLGTDVSTPTNITSTRNIEDGTAPSTISPSLETDESTLTNSTSTISGPPLNLAISQVTNHSFLITWNPPAEMTGEFIKYQVHIVSNAADYYLPATCGVPSKKDEWIDAYEESYMFYDGAPDYIYQVTVFLVNDAGNGENATTTVITLTSPSQEPRNFKNGTQLLDVESNAISINATWQMPCYANGPIILFEISINGSYMPNNSITDVRSIYITASDTEYFARVLEKLMPASNYTIRIRANGETEKGIFAQIELITEDNWPGAPIIKNITNRQSKSFTVSWDEPERRAGYITKYELNIISWNPMYAINLDRCSIQNESLNITLDGNTRTLNITDRSPYYRYNLSVKAFTSRGFGKEDYALAETKSSEPEKPENVSFILKNNNTGNISWTAPCYLNGPAQYFMIKLRWFYSVDQSFTDEKIYSVSYQTDAESYYDNVSLIEAHRYEATIWIVLTDGTAGSVVQTNITTTDGYPGAPNITSITDLDESSFTVSWVPPNSKTGRIIDYQVIVTSLGPLYPTICPINNETYTYNMSSGSLTTYRFNKGQPYYNYSVLISASTSIGFGSASEKVFTNTKPAVPETVHSVTTRISNVTEEEYNAYLNVSFEAPCRLNGELNYYQLGIFGVRTNYPEHQVTLNSSFINDTSFSNVNLWPEYNYTLYIKTVNEIYKNKTGISTFSSPVGVPLFSSAIENLSITPDTSTALLTLKKDYFDAKNGDIKYVALIISDQNTTENFQSWDEEVWPPPSSFDGRMSYQITEDRWYPFEESNEVFIKIGEDTKCTNSQNHCNKRLENNKAYYLVVRIFTTQFYKDSPAIHFITDDLSKLGTILGSIFGLLAFALIATAIFIVWQRKIIGIPLIQSRKSSNKSATNINTAVPSYKFLQYFKTLENNPEKLSEQYALLTEKTKEAVRMQTCMYAALTENRRKNRYTNILPYDDTRVKLLIDEDDEIGSDYVNASYIRGYSGRVEYIATQGPLPTTCRDFWKMVVQEKVSIIVMVTQFIEQNKEKCYKYFPNNHESMSIGEDMEVKCTVELHFGTYCVRTLQVKKDTTQVTVTHMQYLEWPDFNVPSGTDIMLQFCCQLRDRLDMEGGYVVVHCSAGVGRTGTLIATDILLQTINAGKHIDVFSVVLELRKQRTNMVQTQTQYMYIHNLIRDSIDQFHTSGLNDKAEAIHETTSALKTKTDDDNLINKEKESESQF